MVTRHLRRLTSLAAVGSAVLVVLALSPVPVAASCGCAGMTIEAERSEDAFSHVYCAPPDEMAPLCIQEENAEVPPEYRCTDGLVPWQCPLGLTVDYDTGVIVGYGFEVVAELTPGSDPAECRRGQVTQSTRFRNGVLDDNPPASASPPGGTYSFGGPAITVVPSPVDVPQIGRVEAGRPVFGADNYTEVRDLQRALPDLGQLYWWDKPGGALPLQPPSTRSQTDVFIALVQGGEGQCWCQFELKQEWTRESRTGAAALLAGENCTLVQ